MRLPGVLVETDRQTAATERCPLICRPVMPVW